MLRGSPILHKQEILFQLTIYTGSMCVHHQLQMKVMIALPSSSHLYSPRFLSLPGLATSGVKSSCRWGISIFVAGGRWIEYCSRYFLPIRDPEIRISGITPDGPWAELCKYQTSRNVPCRYVLVCFRPVLGKLVIICLVPRY